MKTKLTLNIDDKIIARAKRASERRKVSLSSVVEEYLDRFSKNDSDKKNDKPSEPSLVERIRKYTSPVEISDEEIEKRKEEYLREKYGF
jgi:cysteinyl-tRNA synthetase